VTKKKIDFVERPKPSEAAAAPDSASDAASDAASSDAAADAPRMGSMRAHFRLECIEECMGGSYVGELFDLPRYRARMMVGGPGRAVLGPGLARAAARGGRRPRAHTFMAPRRPAPPHSFVSHTSHLTHPIPPKAEDAEVARAISAIALGGGLGSASISSSLSELTTYVAHQGSV
jgi:hypothetical protein